MSLVEDLHPFRLGGWPQTFFRHVEGHVAARMRREGMAEGEVVLNNIPCGNRGYDNDFPYTCEKLLRSVLPSGSRLTVWATQDGGQTWWHRTYVGTGERIKP